MKIHYIISPRNRVLLYICISDATFSSFSRVPRDYPIGPYRVARVIRTRQTYAAILGAAASQIRPVNLKRITLKSAVKRFSDCACDSSTRTPSRPLIVHPFALCPSARGGRNAAYQTSRNDRRRFTLCTGACCL